MTQPNHVPPYISRRAPRALWRLAGAFLQALFDRFGEPQVIAQRLTLPRETYNTLRRWVRAGEALLRRFILIEAALQPPQPSCPRQRYRRRSSAPIFDPAQPSSWRVRFRALPEPPRTGRRRVRSRPHRTPQSDQVSAFPIARRCEALLRAFNTPAPYARRLRQRLSRDMRLRTRLTSDGWMRFRTTLGAALHDALREPVSSAMSVLAITDSS